MSQRELLIAKLQMECAKELEEETLEALLGETEYDTRRASVIVDAVAKYEEDLMERSDEALFGEDAVRIMRQEAIETRVKEYAKELQEHDDSILAAMANEELL